MLFATSYEKTKNVVEEKSENFEKPKYESKLFIPSRQYTGSKPGYVFKTGNFGLGYYFDKII